MITIIYADPNEVKPNGGAVTQRMTVSLSELDAAAFQLQQNGYRIIRYIQE